MAIDYEKKDKIAVVKINRPQDMNCLNFEDLEELNRVWLDFTDDDSMLVGILTGAGEKAFCAGADLASLLPKVTSGEFTVLPTMAGFLKNINCFKPIVAGVNGICLAGGTEMLQGTDIRIAVDHATFGIPEVKWGIFPGAGSTVRLPRQIPYCRAMELLLLGNQISADEALNIGLINRVVPKEKLMDTVMEIAHALCENGPLAMQAIKKSALKTYDIPEEHAYHMEAFLAGQVYNTDDAKEGPMAFVEKRKPVFKGR